VALNDAALELMADALAAEVTHLSLHSSTPNSSGSNEVTGGGYSRQSVTWNVDQDGDLTLASTVSFSGPSEGTVTHVGLWDASSSGNFYGAFALSGDTAFNSAGQYNVTQLTINSTAS